MIVLGFDLDMRSLALALPRAVHPNALVLGIPLGARVG